MPDAEIELDDLIESLSSPDAYPRFVDEVTVLQTHISVLFFAGDRVYKLKKPVELPFLDYTSVEARRHYCERELLLNRRISPRMYLGLLPVTRDDDGRVVVDGSGAVVDWLVEMIRLPADRMLDVLLDEGRIGEEQLEHVAIVLARFHERAMTGPTVNRYGLAPAVIERVVENIDQLSRTPGSSSASSPAVVEFLRQRAIEFPHRHRTLLERRVAEWRIREGHGDLHAGNICLVGEEVYVFDCVEFDRGLRCADVASDMAFLLMDLDHRGHRWAADRLVAMYSEITSDADFASLIAFYRTYRALVRAKVELETARDQAIDPEKRGEALTRAQRYVQLAVGYELPACLILTCGLPATGKSHAAQYVAGRFRASLLRSDALREHGGNGHAGPSRYGRGAYSPERRDRVYEQMLERAADVLGRGGSAVVDATFARRSFRQPFLDMAARLRIPCYLLRMDTPESVVRERLERRPDHPGEPSDAGLETYLEESKRFEPPEELPPDRVVACSGTESPEEHCRALQERMVAALGGG